MYLSQTRHQLVKHNGYSLAHCVNITEISGIQAALEEGIGITVLAKSVVAEKLSIIPLETSMPALGDIGMVLTINQNCTVPAARNLLFYIKQALLELSKKEQSARFFAAAFLNTTE